ncbi:DUF4249 family protein [Flammeovirga aprica]|uniref:DUF4249 family protein n=1 Tax=Flammeovirga aprica JL-4 TaxID=694437 RepID=A0A7X9S154_9BACT|nr:DUF4249 family protein [Flammeovirga aprica]NME72247.1 DUF4249 family protein [Flammeovirga aprica JL-4]
MNYIKYILISWVVFSCTNTEVDINTLDAPVVVSYLHPNQEAIVDVTYQIDFINGDTTAQKIEGLNIMLSDGENEYELEEIGDGLYKQSSMLIQEEKAYTLSFDYKEVIISSITEVPTKPTGFELSASYIEAFSVSGGFPNFSRPEPVSVTYSNPLEEYHYIGVRCVEENPTLINAIEEDEELPSLAFHIKPSTGDKEQLTPFQFMYYGKHEVILYKVTPEFAALFDQEDNSSINITDPYTNIENGFGIFSGINSDTLSLLVI